MPTYDYLCPNCGPFEARRPMRESQQPVTCAGCDGPAPRLPSAPSLNLMASNNRIAETRNEKSAHEPDIVHRMKPQHHAHGAAHHVHAHPPRASPRPWMLGH